MDLSFGEEYEASRGEVREFIANERAHPIGQQADWTREERGAFIRAAVERGYMYRNFPKRYGGSEQQPDPLLETIIAEEMDNSEVPWRLQAQGVGMIVPTLLELGAQWQREKFIAPTLNGEFVWCQGYSEPGAGSDLASLRSTAVLDGGEWVINGHKIWTSDVQDSNYMFGMFRSEPDAPKHAGISYLLLEVDQPGIEIRPLRQITGVAHFSEVFFTDVRTPADWIVGERGQGWQVARVNLKYERNLGGAGRARRQLRDLVDLAKRSTLNGRPALEDAGIRRRLAEIECRIRCIETTGLRTLSAVAAGEEDKLGITLIVNKLYQTDTTDLAGRLAYDLIGEDGLRAPTDETYGHVRAGISDTGWIDQYLYALAGAIAAGSSNIQRNIVGERGLGLPRDIRANQVR